MSILTKAKERSREDIIHIISDTDIHEYGVFHEKVSEKLALAASEEVPVSVIAALNNSDTDGVLLELLKEDLDKVLDGIAITGYAVDAKEMILQLPDYAEALKTDIQESANERGIQVEVGLVDVRKYQNCLIEHIATAKHIAESMDGSYEEAVYVSVNGGKLTAFPTEKELSEVVSLDEAKAVLAGYEYYLPEELEGKKLGDMGIYNGVITVLTNEDCMVQNVQERLLSSRKQSCGKCVFCREGLIQLEGMQKDMAEGKGKVEYLSLTQEIGEGMCQAGLCSMGKQSAIPALSAISKFTSEFEEHIKKKNCPAGKCNSFVTLYIDPKACTGCGACMDVCPKDCIEGKAGYIHMIDEFECSKCNACIKECEEEAIMKATGKLPKLPTRLTKVGKFKKH